jgi:hypothetical protein
MYRSGRPNRLAPVLNRAWAVVGSAGLSGNRLVTLEVRGRRSGRLISFPLVIADYEGEHYLVAMLDEGANWVATVRAARGQVILRHGRRQAVRSAWWWSARSRIRSLAREAGQGATRPDRGARQLRHG